MKYGLTIPLQGQLFEQKAKIEELSSLGYTDVWSAEALGYDGLTPLALASVWAPELRLGTAILPAYTRGPALLAQSAAAMSSAAPGRFILGLGTSSNIIVENYNAIAFEEPYKRVRDTINFLREAFKGEKITAEYDTFNIKGFRLLTLPPEPVPILLAALRENMLKLAGQIADGAILNWLSPQDAESISQIVCEQNPKAEIAARLFVCPNPDRDLVLSQAKRVMAAYLNVPVYRAFHEWRGRGPALQQHWELWAKGERAESLEAIPDEIVDELFVHGSPEACRARIHQYCQAGITTPVLAIMPLGGIDEFQAARDLAPN